MTTTSCGQVHAHATGDVHRVYRCHLRAGHVGAHHDVLKATYWRDTSDQIHPTRPRIRSARLL